MGKGGGIVILFQLKTYLKLKIKKDNLKKEYSTVIINVTAINKSTQTPKIKSDFLLFIFKNQNFDSSFKKIIVLRFYLLISYLLQKAFLVGPK